jgi:hypothetical protein
VTTANITTEYFKFSKYCTSCNETFSNSDERPRHSLEDSIKMDFSGSGMGGHGLD